MLNSPVNYNMASATFNHTLTLMLQDDGHTQGCSIFCAFLLGLNKEKGVMVQYYTCGKHETSVKRAQAHVMCG